MKLVNAVSNYLKSNGYYYDRKKNFYKNQGMPVAKIISISYMAQAIMAIILFKPDSARARPSTLINSDADYKEIFSQDRPIDVYLKVIQIMKTVEAYLKPDSCQIHLERKIITNIKFYMAMLATIYLLGTCQEQEIEKKLSELIKVEISNEILSESLQQVQVEFNKLGATDQVAKGSDLVLAIKRCARDLLVQRPS